MLGFGGAEGGERAFEVVLRGVGRSDGAMATANWEMGMEREEAYDADGGDGVFAGDGGGEDGVGFVVWETRHGSRWRFGWI